MKEAKMSDTDTPKTNEQRKQDIINAIIDSVKYTLWLMLYLTFALVICNVFNAPEQQLRVYKLQVLMLVVMTFIGLIYEWCKATHPDKRNVFLLIGLVDFCYGQWLFWVWVATSLTLIKMCNDVHLT